MLLQLAALALLIPAALAAGYYFSMMLVALCVRHKRPQVIDGSRRPRRFAIVIPAHNEEQSIGATLDSCLAFSYPGDSFRIFVIADNCTDNTARVAMERGVDCLVRSDSGRRGKGQALAWAFDRLLDQSFDAFVVIDADCVIDKNALQVFDGYLARGAQALQANNVSANPDESAMSYAVSVGNLMENQLLFLPRDKLGLPIQLRGTGMVLTVEILRKLRWSALSAVEDMEYSLRLFKNRIKIRFVPEVKVSSDSPVHRQQLDVQRTRWAGNLAFGRKDALKLIFQGLSRGPRSLIEVGWSLLVLSKPLVLIELLLTLLLSTLCLLIYPGPISEFLLLSSMLVAATQIVYFTSAMFMLGWNKRRVGYLLRAPYVVSLLAVISVSGMLRFDRKDWSKTPRDN